MGGVRPITDVWILGRPKVKYYGAYPAGFLERARPLIVGGDPDASVWHMPGGMCKKYNVKPGGHVGVLDYMWPAPKTGKQVAAIAVGTGKNARARWFTVWRS